MGISFMWIVSGPTIQQEALAGLNNCVGSPIIKTLLMNHGIALLTF
jgi:hypothetical protein